MFVQIMSKGVLSMEELKSQLGDRMPVAMSVAAKAMGYPNEKMGEFIKLVSEGKVQSRDFILKFSDALRQNVRDSKALEASIKTVGTAQARLALAGQTSVFAGFQSAAPGIIDFFNTLGRVLTENENGFSALGSAVGLIMKGLATAINLISPLLVIFSFYLERLRDLFSDALDLSKTREEISYISVGLRLVISLFQILLGYVYKLAAGAIRLTQSLGMEEGGLGWILDTIAALIGVTIVAAIVKAIGKMFALGAAAKEAFGKVRDAINAAKGNTEDKKSKPKMYAGGGKIPPETGKGGLGKSFLKRSIPGVILMTGLPLLEGYLSDPAKNYLSNISSGMGGMGSALEQYVRETNPSALGETTINVINPQLNVVNPVNGNAADAGAAAGQALADQLAASVGG